MNASDLDFFERWFSGYGASFYELGTEVKKNLSFKKEHTYRVIENTVRIAIEESVAEDKIMLARTAALFHDAGRFPQFAKYRTFRDGTSVNHGELGARVLLEEGVLKRLPEDEQEIILNAVRFHNSRRIPDLERPEAVFSLRLIRDADKLDIFRVFTGFYEGDKNEVVLSGLELPPDAPEYSGEILSCLYEGQTASYAKIRTLNDAKLLQLSWVYDLNFRTSFRMLAEEDYIGRIAGSLPEAEEIKKAARLLKEYANQRLSKP